MAYGNTRRGVKMKSIRQYFRQVIENIESSQKSEQELLHSMKEGAAPLLRWVDQINCDLNKAGKNIEIGVQLGGRSFAMRGFLPRISLNLTAIDRTPSHAVKAMPGITLYSVSGGSISDDVCMKQSYYEGFQHLAKWLAHTLPHDCLDTVCETLDRIERQEFRRKMFGTPELRQG